jgi:hypothetical protein
MSDSAHQVGMRCIGNTIISAQRHSIYCGKAQGAVIIGNTVRDHRDANNDDTTILPAIMLARSANVKCIGNEVFNAAGGSLYVGSSDDDPVNRNGPYLVLGNTFAHPADSTPGLVYIGQLAPATEGVVDAVDFMHNTITAPANRRLMTVYNGTNVRIHSNKFRMPVGSHGRKLRAERPEAAPARSRRRRQAPRSEHRPRLAVAALPRPRRQRPATVRWKRRSRPILDQGNLGSCTIQALVGCWPPTRTGTPSAQGRAGARTSLDVQTAYEPLYREETRLDPFPGAWEPDDTGSGRAVLGQGRQATRLASAATSHMTSSPAGRDQEGPFAVGCSWYDGMDNPTSEGVVHATGRSAAATSSRSPATTPARAVGVLATPGATPGPRAGTSTSPTPTSPRCSQSRATPRRSCPHRPAPIPTPTPVPPIPTPTPTPPGPPGPNAFPAPEFEAAETAFRAWLQHHYSEPKTRQLIADGASVLRRDGRVADARLTSRQSIDPDPSGPPPLAGPEGSSLRSGGGGVGHLLVSSMHNGASSGHP